MEMLGWIIGAVVACAEDDLGAELGTRIVSLVEGGASIGREEHLLEGKEKRWKEEGLDRFAHGQAMD